jgi:hypothetical protein
MTRRERILSTGPVSLAVATPACVPAGHAMAQFFAQVFRVQVESSIQLRSPGGALNNLPEWRDLRRRKQGNNS